MVCFTGNYDYVIVNNDLELCYNQISKYIDGKINGDENQYDTSMIEAQKKN